jgi:hypothetical protein
MSNLDGNATRQLTSFMWNLVLHNGPVLKLVLHNGSALVLLRALYGRELCEV